MPRSCVHGARSWSGRGSSQCRALCLPRSPFSALCFRAVCDRRSRPGVPYPRSVVRHSMRSVRSAGSVRLPFWYSPRIRCVCVRSRSRGAWFPLPSPGRCGARTSHGRGLRTRRAVPSGLCPSACLASVPCSVWLASGGGAVPFPPSLGLGRVPPLEQAACPGRSSAGKAGEEGGGGGLCALPRSVPLPSLCRQQSRRHRGRSGYGGGGPHTA